MLKDIENTLEMKNINHVQYIQSILCLKVLFSKFQSFLSKTTSLSILFQISKLIRPSWFVCYAHCIVCMCISTFFIDVHPDLFTCCCIVSHLSVSRFLQRDRTRYHHHDFDDFLRSKRCYL